MSKSMKIFAVVSILLLVAIIVIQVFVKDKIVLEDTSGNDLVGFSGKVGIKPELLDKN
jgi:hypothetical protein